MDTPYRTVEQIVGMKPLEVDPTTRGALSRAPDLEAMADSTVPGTSRHHVRGPQQTAVDPAAAGLDTAHTVHSAHARAAMEAPAPEEAPPPAEAPATEPAPVAAKAPAKSAPAAPAATA
ncbi:hypothetical protein MSKU15_1281 [Komagataeibacter diospyri]|uniref:hypothetical protein n=1 Tax=Komagataeibacter diospyri TaxID=1932662 RepID=UPI00113DC8A5|nr:hypothetical protein [Komagataeibacter diospyri]GCE89680.1 hypothetical protein MSKU15_1281 [Komagataeibacter diospyri]